MPPTLKWILLAAVVAAALYGLDWLLLAAEARGFIYYRKRQGSPGSVGGAMMEIQAHLQPSARHIVEEQRRVVEEEDNEGAPPPDLPELPTPPSTRQ